MAGVGGGLGPSLGKGRIHPTQNEFANLGKKGKGEAAPFSDREKAYVYRKKRQA